MNISPWFHRCAMAAVAWAVLLVWVGAAVTTKGVGMVVPTWPLTWGGVNPEGWWDHPGVRLEHGHRLLGAVMGLLVLALAAWAWIGRYPKGMRTLTLIALAAVIFQGVLGGLRVTEISDGFAVFHGCVAQAFFCLLILIVMLSSPKRETRRREQVEAASLKSARTLSVAFVGVIYLQLILGATMRHTHRIGLADDGILTTGGAIFPGFGDFDLAILFSHKAWAIMVLAASVAVSDHAMRRLKANPALRLHAFLLSGLVTLQILLGVSVIVTGKGFLVTGFHVLNGLAILAGAFMLAVKCFAASPERKETASSASDEESGDSARRPVGSPGGGTAAIPARATGADSRAPSGDGEGALRVARRGAQRHEHRPW